MSRTVNAEELKDQYISLMGSGLGSVFYALYNEFAWLHVRWWQYLQLFAATRERVVVLNEAAGLFFRVVQDSLWEDTLLHLARITDKPDTGGKANLTIQRLSALLTDKQLAAEIRTLVDDAVTRAGFARDWRNRRMAHIDLALAVEEGAKPLAAASRRSVDDALKSIDAVLNHLEMHFRNSTIFFEGFGHPGDAEALLYVVRDGLAADEARRKRLREGRPLDEDFQSRPV